MTQLHFPWLEASALIPLIGWIWVGRIRNPDRAKRHCLTFAGLALLTTFGAWIDFSDLHRFQAHDHPSLIEMSVGGYFFMIDEVNAPLLPMVALLFFLTCLATLRTKVKRFSFNRALLNEAITLATFSSEHQWSIVALLAIGTLPVYWELRLRARPTAVFVLHMAVSIGLLAIGCGLDWFGGERLSIVPVILIMAAILIRSGIVPVHCWITDLFEHATFGTSVLFVTPMVGAYAAVRLLLPIAPDWVLHTIAVVSLITAVYAAGMALVQTEARRFFCYLFLSHSSLVLVGLELATPIGLTGALCVWMSVGLALTGFGLTLRAVESRTGRISLRDFHGLYEHVPVLAVFFLLTGLASIGFPGTIGFVGSELLVEGAVDVYPYVGMAVVFAGALNGIAVVHAFLRIFTGARHTATISLRSSLSERAAVLTLTMLILGGGLFPQPGVASRYHAAMKIVSSRRALALSPTPDVFRR